METETKKKMRVWDCILCVVIGIVVIMFGLSTFMDATSTANKYRGTKWVAQDTKKEAEENKVGGIVAIGIGGAFLCVGIFDYNKRKQKYAMNVGSTKDSTATKLEELKKMLDQKIITEEEFENKKKELLKKM